MTRKERRAKQFAHGKPTKVEAKPSVAVADAPAGFAKPREVNGWSMVLGAGREVYDLMPAMADIPDEFRRGYGNPYVKLQAEWFFKGLDARRIVAKPGIDRTAALDHLAAIQRSFEPAHEHKEAGVAYLMSLWFDIA